MEPAERDAGNALLVAVLAILLVALAFLARQASGSVGLTGFVFVVLLGTIVAGLLIL